MMNNIKRDISEVFEAAGNAVLAVLKRLRDFNNIRPNNTVSALSATDSEKKHTFATSVQEKLTKTFTLCMGGEVEQKQQSATEASPTISVK